MLFFFCYIGEKVANNIIFVIKKITNDGFGSLMQKYKEIG